MFENGALLRGSYSHFTGLKFKGSFKNLKFSKGTIQFPDGEKLQLACRLSKGKWILSRGKLMTSKGKFIEKFENNNNIIKSRNKIIHQNHEIFGFCVEYQNYTDMRNNKFSPLII